MNGLLEGLAGLAARRHWVVIIAWVIILGGLLAAKSAFGGEYVNNYTIPGSNSADGLNVLNSTFPQQGGYGGQIVFHATKGTVADQQSAVSQSVTNVSKLPDVIKAVSPFASGNTGAVSQDGTIAYASVGWSVNPDSLDSSYLDKLNNAVEPATKAGLQVAYGAGAGEIGRGRRWSRIGAPRGSTVAWHEHPADRSRRAVDLHRKLRSARRQVVEGCGLGGAPVERQLESPVGMIRNTAPHGGRVGREHERRAAYQRPGPQAADQRRAVRRPYPDRHR